MMTQQATKIVRLFGSAAFMALASQAANADSGGKPSIALDPAEARAAAAEVQQVAEAALTGGSSSSATFGSLARAIQIETSGDDTNASVSFAFNRSHPLGNGREKGDGSTRFTFATDSVGFTATAPLGKGGKPSLFSFDGMGDDTSLTLSFARYIGSVNYVRAANPDSQQALQGKLVNRCVDSRSTVWINRQSAGDAQKETVARLVAAELRTKLDRQAAERGAGPELVLVELSGKSDDEKLKALAGYLATQCTEVEGSEVTLPQLIATYATEEEKAAIAANERSGRRLGGPDQLTFYGAKAKISRANYEFLVQTPLEKQDFSRTNYKIEAFSGLVFDSGLQSLTGAFSYTRSYKAGDETRLCEPNGIGAQLVCLEGPLGQPSRTDKYIVSGEYRRMFKIGGLPGDPTIGIAPRVSYEFKSDAALFELPIYFAPNDKKALNGGLRMAYDTGKDDFAIGLFVGVPFSVFSN